MLTLQAGASSLVLAPEIGGAHRWLEVGRMPLLRRGAGCDHAGNVRGLACFPLVPFSNRIANGRFQLGGHGPTRWTAISATIRIPSTAWAGSAPGRWRRRAPRSPR